MWQEINSTRIICLEHHSLYTGWSTHTHTHTDVTLGVSNISSRLTLLHQPAVVRHDLALREVKSHLQGNQHRELQRKQLTTVYSETLFQLLLSHMQEDRGDKRKTLWKDANEDTHRKCLEMKVSLFVEMLKWLSRWFWIYMTLYKKIIHTCRM